MLRLTRSLSRLFCTLALGLASATVLADGFSTAGTLAQGRFGHTATLLSSGKVLVVGGATLDTILASAELYDPARNAWSAAGPLAQPRTYHTATLLVSGKVLVVGGVNGPSPLASAELYDPVANTWTSAGSIGTPRTRHTSITLDSGKVLVAFGTSGANGTNPLTTTMLYDPPTNTWSAGSNASSARSYHAILRLPNGNLLASGGLGAGNAPLSSSTAYAQASGSWIGPIGAMATPRLAFPLTLLADGKVLAVGGYATAALAGVERYDPATNQWTSVAAMSTPRASHAASLLGSGKVLASGGIDASNTALASAAVYDPAVNAWSATGAMAVARAQHTMTWLDNGKVLVVGGQGPAPDYAAVAAAELFAVDPVFRSGFD